MGFDLRCHHDTGFMTGMTATDDMDVMCETSAVKNQLPYTFKATSKHHCDRFWCLGSETKKTSHLRLERNTIEATYTQYWSNLEFHSSSVSASSNAAWLKANSLYCIDPAEVVLK